MSSPVPPPVMSTPPPPPPPEVGKSSRRGCLIAVLVCLLLLMASCGGACIYIVRNPGRTMAWSLGMGRGQLVASMATSCTEQQKADFASEFDAYIEFARALDFARVQAAGEDAKKFFAPAEFIGEASKDQQITCDEAARFVELSRAARSLP